MLIIKNRKRILSGNKLTYHPLSIQGHKSLHSYLDAVFKDYPNPDIETIIATKKEYWRQYYRIYRKQYRQQYKEYRLHFDTDTLADIKQKKGKLSTSKFLYQCVLQVLEGNTGIHTGRQTYLESISHQLLKIIYLLEELADNGASELTADLIDRITRLESDIQHHIFQTDGH